jgi:CRP-like cAMP-binding protein
MASHSKPVKLKQGETLMKEGDPSTSLYWLQQGQMSVVKQGDNEEEVLLGFVYQGEVVGEMSFLDSSVRSATVKAESDCNLIEIPSENFEKIFNSQPKWMQILIKTLVERLRRTNARIQV